MSKWLSLVFAVGLVTLLRISVVSAAVINSGFTLDNAQNGATCTASRVDIHFDITGVNNDSGSGIDNFGIALQDGLGRLLAISWEHFVEVGSIVSVDTFVPFYQDPSGPLGGPGNIPLARPFHILIVDDSGGADPSTAPVIGTYEFDPATDVPSCAGLPYIDKPNSQDFGFMNGGTDYVQAIAANTVHIYRANISTMPFKFDFQTRTDGLNHSLYLLDANGNVVDTTLPAANGRNIIYNDSIPTGNYYILVVPEATYATGTYAITLWFTTYPRLSLDWPTNAHSSTALGNLMHWYFTCDTRCNPGYIRYMRDAGSDIVWNYTISKQGVGTIATGTLNADIVYIPLSQSDGTFDLLMTAMSGSGSYWLQIFPGTAPIVPPASGFRFISQPNVLELFIGDTGTFNIVADNPNLASGGGIRGADFDCSVDGTIAQSTNVVLQSAFSPQAIGTLWTPLPSANFGYLIAEGVTQPSVTATGSVISAEYTALARGTTNLVCITNAIGADESYIENVPFIGAMIVVVGNGTIEGYVILGDAIATNAGASVMVRNAGGTIVATVTTDVTGHFSVDVRPGVYTLEASAPAYLRAATSANVDVNGDQVNSINSVVLLGGNINGDDQISLLDLVLFSSNYATQRVTPTLNYNPNRDSRVNLQDFYILVQNYGAVGPINWNP